MGLLQPVRSMVSPPEALHIIMLARAAVTTMAPRTRAKSRLFGKNGQGWRQCWRTPMGSRFYESTLVHPGTRNFITLPGDTIDTVLLASSIVSSQNAAVPLPLADMATPWEWPQCANRSTPQELPKPGACKEVSSRCAAAQGFDRPPDTAP